MIIKNKDIKKITFFESKKIGNAQIDFVRNSNEICLMSLFKINGKVANIFELGISKDINPEKAPPTGCGNRIFIPNFNYSEQLLDKYGVSKEDMDEILKYLECQLKIGCCKYCT